MINDFDSSLNISLSGLNISGVKAFELNVNWAQGIVPLPTGFNFGLKNVHGNGGVKLGFKVPTAAGDVDAQVR